MKLNRNQKKLTFILSCVMLFMVACRQDMHDQPRYEPLEESTFFADARSSRPLVAGTVPRGHLDLDEHFYTGKVNGEPVTTFPFEITREVIKRGQERYNIFCSPCHDRVGRGKGMIVRRGLKQPPSFHTIRLREAPVGHFFDVITNGFGVMPSYADKVKPRDRWAIIAYIRALQLSQNINWEELTPQEKKQSRKWK
ncbi:MAG: cytochrome c [Calditrichaeota bacterium]|nr:MAG: cytochrome c [Calditrichota bacterium]